MSKERLQDIKKKYNYERLGEFIDVKPVNPYELKWLIQQAERVQELEEFNRILSSDKSMFIEELVREQQQNKRYREALEFYANEENYKPFDGIFLLSYQNKVDEDEGKKARKALREGEE